MPAPGQEGNARRPARRQAGKNEEPGVGGRGGENLEKHNTEEEKRKRYFPRNHSHDKIQTHRDSDKERELEKKRQEMNARGRTKKEVPAGGTCRSHTKKRVAKRWGWRGGKKAMA